MHFTVARTLVSLVLLATLFDMSVASECDCGLGPSQRQTVLSQLETVKTELATQETRLLGEIGQGCLEASGEGGLQNAADGQRAAHKNAKRGIAMNNLGAVLTSSGTSAIGALEASSISWTYNWAATPSSPIAPSPSSASVLGSAGLSFVPMAWGSDSLHDLDADLSAIVDARTSAGVILGFNEPNHRAQANLSPDEAARLWPKLEAAAAAAGAETLVGPAVNWSPDEPWKNPWEWYDAFFAAYPSARIDALAFHSYNCAVETMRYYVAEYKALLARNGREGTPLWLTEFACADDPQRIPGNEAGLKGSAQQCDYIRELVPYLDSESSVERYSWFAHSMAYTGNVALVDENTGAMTELGRCYSEA